MPEIDVEAYYRQFAPMVYRRCLFFLRNEDAALDVMQEVFVQVLRFQSRLKHQGPSSLLYTIATRLSLNALRQKSTVGLFDEISAPAVETEGVENRWMIERIFQKEAPETQVMAVCHYVDRMTLEETAQMVGLSVSGVRKRLSRLRERAARYKEK